MSATTTPNTSSTDGGRLLSIEEMAGYLGVSTHTVYKWSCRKGDHFPKHFRLPNRAIRVRQSAIDAWLEGIQNR